MEQNIEKIQEIYSWGSDRFGQLAVGRKDAGKSYNIPFLLTIPILVREVSCGEEHSAMISFDGKVYTVGSNSEGRLGIGNQSLKYSSIPLQINLFENFRKAIKISCGWGHSAVICENGELFTWGTAEFGSLGINSTDVQWKPVLVDIPGKVTIKDVSCGSRHTAILDSLGRLFTFGTNEVGQLGILSRRKQTTPLMISSISVELDKVCCGGFHTIILSKSGDVLTMGGNINGELGNGTRLSNYSPAIVESLKGNIIVKIAASNYSAAINQEGDVFIWGSVIFGDNLLPKKLNFQIEKIKEISLGKNYGIAIDKIGDLYSWGSNSFGELGLGDYEPRINPTLILTLKGKRATRVSTGGSHTISIIDLSIKENTADPITLNKDKSHQTFQTLRECENIKLKLSANFDSESVSSPNSIYTAKLISKKENKEIEKYYEIKNKTYKEKIVLPSPLDIYNNSKRDLNLNSKTSMSNSFKAQELKKANSLIEINDNTVENKNYSNNEFKEIKNMEITNFESNNQMNLKELLNDEMVKNLNLNKELEQSKEKINDMSQEIISLSCKFEQILEEIKTLDKNSIGQEEIIKNLKSENEILKKCSFNNIDNAKLKEILIENENKLQIEIELRTKIMLEKELEIGKLQDHISSLELKVQKKQEELIKKEEGYKNECLQKESLNDKLKEEIANYEIQLNSAFSECAKKENEISRLNLVIFELEEKNKILLEDTDNLNKKYEEEQSYLKSTEQILAAEKCKNNEFQKMLDLARSSSLSLTKDITEENTRVKDQLSNLANQLNDSNINNENSKNLTNKLEHENQNLLSEIESWKIIVDKLGNENNELKMFIQDLELKNKKLNENLGKEIYNKAIEYQERTVTALKNSSTPYRLKKILSSGKKINSNSKLKLNLNSFAGTENVLNEENYNLNLNSSEFCDDIESSAFNFNSNSNSNFNFNSNFKDKLKKNNKPQLSNPLKNQNSLLIDNSNNSNKIDKIDNINNVQNFRHPNFDNHNNHNNYTNYNNQILNDRVVKSNFHTIGLLNQMASKDQSMGNYFFA